MHLAIRADGNSEIGYGHLVRTGAIAREFIERGHEVTYYTSYPDSVRESCPDGIRVITLPQNESWTKFLSTIQESSADIVIVDSYQANTERQRSLYESAPGLHGVVMDDTRYRVCVDFVINGNIFAPSLEYEWEGAEPSEYLGVDYLPIRREICEWKEKLPRFRRSPNSALITMGGSDVKGLTPQIIKAFEDIEIPVTVVVGPGFSNQAEIKTAVTETDGRFDVREDPPNLPELMANADLAVTAAGSTVYELLALGTPMIAIPQADNQVPVARSLSKRELAMRLDPHELDLLPERIETLLNEPEIRHNFRQRGLELVDCAGPERLFSALSEEVN